MVGVLLGEETTVTQTEGPAFRGFGNQAVAPGALQTVCRVLGAGSRAVRTRMVVSIGLLEYRDRWRGAVFDLERVWFSAKLCNKI